MLESRSVFEETRLLIQIGLHVMISSIRGSANGDNMQFWRVGSLPDTRGADREYGTILRWECSSKRIAGEYIMWDHRRRDY